MKRATPRRSLVTILAAIAIGCGPPAPTDDPEMNRAAGEVHQVMLVLEPAMLGLGFVAGAAPG